MHPNCKQQINAARAAQGRNGLTAAQEAAIDSRMSAKLRQLARTDENWQSSSRDQRYLLAAQAAQQDLAAEAARKVANAQRQVLRTAETEQRIAEVQAQDDHLAGLLTRLDQLVAQAIASARRLEAVAEGAPAQDAA